ncbi:DUF4302 domain-containing protein [Pontibacter sp. SGAir0037]|uniref:DUF4302 domain-containing protein n=1 Tax=Pontibacter sp. SGAir0037 TaxID=2571030 RepID=UPI00143CEB31|nr:DUF4302 domain-containing protein [Pontibacter sp. SGAir0037]
MKKLALISILLLAVLTACDKNTEPAPGERPEERLSQALAAYKSQLTSAPYGWKAVLYPAGGGGYNFVLKFTESDRVVMSSDINSSTTTAMESTYRLKTMQRPSLLFDTYSYLHILSDPDAAVSGGDYGAGRYSDFEFSFTEASPDQIILTGNMMGSKLVLTRATQEEASSYITDVQASAATIGNLSRFTSYFKRLTIGSTAFDININHENRALIIYYFEGDAARMFTTNFNYTANGIQLQEPFVYGDITITAFSNVQYNAAANRFNLNINSTTATIQEAARPVKVDVQSARTFYNLGVEYWVSLTGFTVNGVEDALNTRSLPNLYFIGYWPQYDVYQNRTYDLLGFVFLDPSTNSLQLEYGAAATTTLSSDGRIVFSRLGTLGEIPETHNTVLNATMNQWTISQGYYVIKTGESSYDLVSAQDGKAWLSLYR